MGECSAVLEGVPHCEWVCPSVEGCYQCGREIRGMGGCAPVWECVPQCGECSAVLEGVPQCVRV